LVHVDLIEKQLLALHYTAADISSEKRRCTEMAMDHKNAHVIRKKKRKNFPLKQILYDAHISEYEDNSFPTLGGVTHEAQMLLQQHAGMRAGAWVAKGQV
jgi:hypothetical protein